MPGQLRGNRRFQTTMRRAQRDMRSTEPSKKAAQIAARAARAAAPRKSGRLSRSIRANGRTVATTVVYAGVQNYGWPRRNIRARAFMYDRMRRVEPTWLRQFTDNTDRALGRVRGI
ncbi:hypothetical protein [Nocardia sp. NPDC057272]|uniref:hypothetical protein n=1 Tax=Nocardia sp. NPDC057272 TaxID=3346079 RepID=UPI003632F771